MFSVILVLYNSSIISIYIIYNNNVSNFIYIKLAVLITGTVIITVKIFECGSLGILCQCRSWASVLVNVEIMGDKCQSRDQEYTDNAEEMTAHKTGLYCNT